MANTPNSTISPQSAVLNHLSLAAATACTTRGPTASAGAAAAFIYVAIPTVTADTKISKISIKGTSTSMTANVAQQLVGVWIGDGVDCDMIDEIEINPGTTPSTTVGSYRTEKLYDDLVLPIGYSLYYSTTVTTTAATTALGISTHGASM